MSPATAEVRRAVRSALEEAPAPAVVVACSGGADSLALAAAAAHVGAAREVAVHGLVVDHGLQPGSTTQAGEACAVLHGLGIDARVATVTVVAAGEGPESAARRARYAALREASATLGGAPVLLGHTLDDQAETVLLGLGRGSGARSLAGMRPWDPPWSRPLLGVRRTTTRAACADAGLHPWDDPHNVDPRYTRVRLRHEVLPLLEDVLSGGVAEALARTADQLADDDAALDTVAAGILTAARDDERGLDTALTAPHPPAVRRRVLRAWLADAGVRGFDDAQVRAVDGLVARWRGQGPPSLPGGLEVIRVRGRLGVRRVRSGSTGWTTGEDRRARRRSPLKVYDGDIASVLITSDEIQDKIAKLADTIAADYGEPRPGEPDLLLVGVLKGAVMFMTDLARRLPVPTQLEFMAISSYGSATSSSGVVRILKDLDRDISNRHVLIVEDIIDSGLTLSWLRKNLESRGPASLHVVTLLRKPEAAKLDVDIAYVGFDIPNEFVVGFGLDYAERYRDLPYIGTLAPSVYA